MVPDSISSTNLTRGYLKDVSNVVMGGLLLVRTRFDPENLPDSMLTLPIMVLESSKLLQNDRFSHSSLAPQEPLWKHFVSEVIPEKLIFAPFGRR